MKILWVKAGGVVPADTGGRIRSLEILRELAKQHSVTLFTYYGRHEKDQHAGLRNFEEVVTVPQELPVSRTAQQYLRYARSLWEQRPFSMQVIGGESGGRLRCYDQAAVRERLAEVVLRGNFDALVCDYIYPAELIDWSLPCPKVLFTHNVEADLWRQQYQLTHNPVKRFLYWKEWRALRAAELDYAQKADFVLTVSEQNREFFAPYVSPERLATIDTGVDCEAFQPGGDSPCGPAMVFTGSMDWLPNQDAVLFFASEVLPRVRAVVPEAELWIVGRYPSRAVKKLSGPRTHVTGRVSDIRPYLQRAPIYVAPLRSGSGTRIKIFEAMAMGKAVVSTTIGAEGLPVRPGCDILISDSPTEFAASVLKLLQDPDSRQTLGSSARQAVESKYGWDAVSAQLEDIVTDVAQGSP